MQKWLGWLLQASEFRERLASCMMHRLSQLRTQRCFWGVTFGSSLTLCVNWSSSSGFVWKCYLQITSWLSLGSMHACHLYPVLKCFGQICCVWSALLSPLRECVVRVISSIQTSKVFANHDHQGLRLSHTMWVLNVLFGNSAHTYYNISLGTTFSLNMPVCLTASSCAGRDVGQVLRSPWCFSLCVLLQIACTDG